MKIIINPPKRNKMSKEQQPKGNIVAIKDLPIYAEPPKLSDYRFIEDEPVIGQQFVHRIRQRCNDYCNAVKERLGIVNKSLEPVKEAATATEDYIRHERDLFPKAAAITLGGMVGFVMSMRKGGRFRRVLYTTYGLLVMSAFCYPHETTRIIRTGIAHTQMTWENFRKSPEPDKGA